mmetsp:Transcript_26379/g.43162  ORF Transcript_26379/g.43162 Transcript_26379/m.43162 type:complete len:364 (-) Transcript_26379:127-1218(-)
MAHGLHVIARTMAPDGTGRDSIFFQDDSWKTGRKGTPAFRTPVARHPLFHSQSEMPGLLSSMRQGEHGGRPSRPVSAVLMPGQKQPDRARPVSAAPSPWHKQGSDDVLDARGEMLVPPSWQKQTERNLLEAGVPMYGPRQQRERPVSAVPLSWKKPEQDLIVEEFPVRGSKHERQRPVSAAVSPSKRLTEQDLLEYEVPLHVQQQSERPRPVSAVPGNTQKHGQRNRPVSAVPFPWQRQTEEDVFPDKPISADPRATCFRARSNVEILLLPPKAAAVAPRSSSFSAAELPGTADAMHSPPQRSPQRRRPRSAAVLGKADDAFLEDEPVWRTRETVIDYNAWATKMPSGMCSTKSVPRRAPLIK